MSQANSPDGGDDRKKLMTVLVPAGAAAVVIVLVAVILALSDKPPGGSDKGKGDLGGATGTAPSAYKDGAGKAMPSDGSNGGTDDPGLKDIGGGLKVRDLKEGTGAEVKAGATISAHYTGWLVNGKEFDSSRKRGQPIEFSLNRVVAGWQKGIPGMKVGGVRKLVIPSEMGYGDGGQGDIPPHATLIFEVEVVDVK